MSEFMKQVGHYVNPQTWHNSSVTLMYKANFREGNALVKKGAKIGANLLVAATGLAMTGTNAAKTLVSTATLVTWPGVATVKYLKLGSLEFMPTFSSTFSTLKKTINQALGVLLSLGAVLAEVAFVGRATTWNLNFQFSSGNSNVHEKFFDQEFPTFPNAEPAVYQSTFEGLKNEGVVSSDESDEDSENEGIKDGFKLSESIIKDGKPLVLEDDEESVDTNERDATQVPVDVAGKFGDVDFEPFGSFGHF